MKSAPASVRYDRRRVTTLRFLPISALLVVAACADDETGADSSASGGAGVGGTGAAGGDTGGCDSANSTVVEFAPTCEPSVLHGTKPEGACCALANECAPSCCACPSGTTKYLGVFCAEGICAPADTTCTSTVEDGCR